MTNREWFNSLSNRELSMRLKHDHILGACPLDFSISKRCPLDDFMFDAHDKGSSPSMEEEEQICFHCWEDWFAEEHKEPEDFLEKVCDKSPSLLKAVRDRERAERREAIGQMEWERWEQEDPEE